MIRILAPRLMSAVASLSSVASLPWALSTRNCDEVNPASVNASLMYGASKSTHRVDDVVSGRITPICRLEAPLVPAEASDLNWDIVDEMSTVKELTLSPVGTVAEADEDDDDEDVDGVDEDDEQPAAIRATAAAAATTPSRGRERECPPPCLLLPSSIR